MYATWTVQQGQSVDDRAGNYGAIEIKEGLQS